MREVGKRAVASGDGVANVSPTHCRVPGSYVNN